MSGDGWIWNIGDVETNDDYITKEIDFTQTFYTFASSARPYVIVRFKTYPDWEIVKVHAWQENGFDLFPEGYPGRTAILIDDINYIFEIRITYDSDKIIKLQFNKIGVDGNVLDTSGNLDHPNDYDKNWMYDRSDWENPFWIEWN